MSLPSPYNTPTMRYSSPGENRGTRILFLLPLPSGLPQNGASPVEAHHSKVDPQHILAGDRLLAGCAHHGLGTLLLTQAGSAQKVATGQLVHGFICGVRRKCSFAGGTLWARNTPWML